MEIRKARSTDAESIHKLSWQLGYSPNLETIKNNIESMVSHDDYELVVVVDDSNQVVGWMSLAVRLRIEDVPFLQVAALVTDEKIRGKGIGRLLMDHAGKVAQKRSLPYIGLHSSKPRTDAHSFYEHIGYQKAKESFFFKKDMR